MANSEKRTRAAAAKKRVAKKQVTKKRVTKKQPAKRLPAKKAAAKRVTKKQPAKNAAAKRVTKKQPARKQVAAKRRFVRRPTDPVDPKPRPGVTTPASRPGGPPTVAVFGAGIAGLTAAHELAERGFTVHVYEPTVDARRRRRGQRDLPPVRLGGMAATQYIAASDVRRFPDKIGSPKRPTRLIAGEHGFRFFPAYYLHIWDTLRRIPIYDAAGRPTPRTVYDNVERVIAQAGTAPNGTSLVIPREAPRSMSEVAGSLQEMLQVGYTPTDLATFFGRFARYLTTSPQRREEELEEISSYDYLVGHDPTTGIDQFHYGEAFNQQLYNMPRILAAFDARRGDARTNMSTYVQLNTSLDRYDSKADGVLNEPTTEAWFDPWFVHLTKLGVKFHQATLRSFDLVESVDPPRLRASIVRGDELDADVNIEPPDFIDVHPPRRPYVDADYFVVATDAFRAELATAHLRKLQRGALADEPDLPSTLVTELSAKRGEARQRLRNLSTVLGLDGFATTGPPQKSPSQDEDRGRRNPLDISKLGQRGWDRFQTLSGIQFFFDTEFQVLLGHVYYSNSDWALSSINATGLWADKPRLDPDGYVSMMSVDIGDWRTRSRRTGRSASESSPDEIAHEVWRQITTELGPPLGEDVTDLQFPQPCWYWIDRFIEFDKDRPIRNHAPYLIPILRDWKNRPGAYPWNPNCTSFTWVPGPEMRATQERLRVWQAGHGGYQVHFDKLVFAGTWTKTFTRMTSMEAASESGRHAVNAILDHYLYAASSDADKDRRESPPISWRMPYGFVDQDLSSPVRLPTPAGDYCFIYDCENREPGDARPTRLLDGEYFDEGLPHPWAISGMDQAAAAASNANSYSNVTYDLSSVVQQLRQWRSVVETLFATTPPPPSAAGSKRGPTRSPANVGLYCQSATSPAPTPGAPTTFTTAGVSSPPRAPSRARRAKPPSGQIRLRPDERYD